MVFGSLIGFSAFRFLVERVSATLATTYAYVNPPVALFVGWWLGHEQFSAQLLLGLPVVLGAVGLQTWAHTRARCRCAALNQNAKYGPLVPPASLFSIAV